MKKKIKLKVFDAARFYVWELSSIIKFKGRYGVYIFRDLNGKAVYVGRSVNLGVRVISHILGKTPELARNKKNIKDKDHYKFLYRVELMCFSSQDYMWVEAYFIAGLKPVFNKSLRSDLPEEPNQLSKRFLEGVSSYYNEYEFNMRDTEYSNWPYYQQKMMKLINKRNMYLLPQVEDILLMEIYNNEVRSGTFKKTKKPITLKTFIEVQRSELLQMISSVSRLSNTDIIEKAKKIAMGQNELKSPSIDKFLNFK